jgi:hypothetical protein
LAVIASASVVVIGRTNPVERDRAGIRVHEGTLISSVQAKPSPTTATVTWTTDVPAESQVQ